MNDKAPKPVPEWKRKLRTLSRWCYGAAFVVGFLLGAAPSFSAGAMGSGVAYGLMLALAVMLLFALVIFIRGLAEPPPGRPGSE